MSFKENLKEMIDKNCDPESWLSCGQQDDICEGTHFVIATTMPNTGIMCGGDGCVFGEWAWFNDVNDMIDYITHLVIPMNLCYLEDQDPQLVMSGNGDEHIFALPFTEKHIPIKDEMYRLWKELQALRETGATFEQVKAALNESDKRSREIDGELVCGFMFFDNYKSACWELLNIMMKTDERRTEVIRIIESDNLNADDAELLESLFLEHCIM